MVRYLMWGLNVEDEISRTRSLSYFVNDVNYVYYLYCHRQANRLVCSIILVGLFRLSHLATVLDVRRGNCKPQIFLGQPQGSCKLLNNWFVI